MSDNEIVNLTELELEELVDRRTRYTKTFRHKNNPVSRIMQINTNPVHYQSNNKWEDICCLFEEKDGVFQNKTNALQCSVYMDSQQDIDVEISTDTGETLKYKLISMQFSNENGEVDLISPVCKSIYCGIQDSPQGDNYVVRQGILPDTVSEYQSFPGRIKHSLYFLNPLRSPNINGDNITVEIKYIVSSNKSISLKVMGISIEDSCSTYDDVEIEFGQDKKTRLAGPYIVDKKGNKAPVLQRITVIDDTSFEIVYVISYDDINKDKSYYPIMLDPTQIWVYTGETRYFYVNFPQRLQWWCNIKGQETYPGSYTARFELHRTGGSPWNVTYENSSASWRQYSGFIPPENDPNHDVLPPDQLGEWRISAIRKTGSQPEAQGWVIYEESPPVYYWNGSSWVMGELRCWNGSEWVMGMVHVWNGSNWVLANP